jgi:hypothetical protein
VIATGLGSVGQAPARFRDGVLILRHAGVEAPWPRCTRGGVPPIRHQRLAGRPGLGGPLRPQMLPLVQPTPDPEGRGPDKVHRCDASGGPSRRARHGRLPPPHGHIPPHVVTPLTAGAVGGGEREEHLPPSNTDPPDPPYTSPTAPAASGCIDGSNAARGHLIATAFPRATGLIRLAERGRHGPEGAVGQDALPQGLLQHGCNVAVRQAASKPLDAQRLEPIARRRKLGPPLRALRGGQPAHLGPCTRRTPSAVLRVPSSSPFR